MRKQLENIAITILVSVPTITMTCAIGAHIHFTALQIISNYNHL